MSIYPMARVWDHSQQRGANLLVLLAMADRADELGILFAGHDYLGSRARINDKRQVRRVVRRLEQVGEIVSVQSRRADGLYLPNHHIITVGASEELLAQAHDRVAQMVSDKGGVLITPTGNITRRGKKDPTGKRSPGVRVKIAENEGGVRVILPPDPIDPEEVTFSELPTAEILWPAALEELELQLNKAQYDSYFRNTTATLDASGLVVHAKNQLAVGWLETRFHPVIAKVVERLAGRPLSITYQAIK